MIATGVVVAPWMVQMAFPSKPRGRVRIRGPRRRPPPNAGGDLFEALNGPGVKTGQYIRTGSELASRLVSSKSALAFSKNASCVGLLLRIYRGVL